MDTQSSAEPPVPGPSTIIVNSRSRKNGIMGKASKASAADAWRLDERVTQRRKELVAQRRKELAELMERHDSAVREAFHLDRFVTLTSFDPEVAKSDTSQVFESFRARYDLVANNIENAPGSGAAGRRTRRAINDKRQSIGVVARASSPLAPVPSVSTPKVSKGKGKMTSRSAPLDSPTGARPKAVPTFRDVPKKGRKSLPSYLDAPAPKLASPSSARGKGRGRGRGGRGGRMSRRKSLGTIARGQSPSEVDELESEDDLVLGHAPVEPVLQPAIPRPKKPRKRKDVDSVTHPASTVKRIKLIHRVPPPVYTHHQQPPPARAYGGSVMRFLQSYVQLDDEGPEVTVEELEAVARTDGAYLRRINELRGHGRLSHAQGAVPQAPEPPRPMGHWDSVIERASGHLKVVRENARVRVGGARRVARLINAYWEKMAGADEKTKRLEEKKMQALVKSTLKTVQALWKDAVKYVKQKKLALEKEEQARKGKEHLDAIIEHSAKALEAQRTLDISGLRDSTDIEESQHESDTSLENDEDDDDVDSQTSHDDDQSSTQRPNGNASHLKSPLPANAEDGEFLEDPLDDAEDFRLAAEMEAEGSDSDGGELNKLGQEAGLPLEELLSRYGYVPNTEDIDDASSVTSEDLDHASVNGNHEEDSVDESVLGDREDAAEDLKQPSSPTPDTAPNGTEVDYVDVSSDSPLLVNSEMELTVTVSGHSTPRPSELTDARNGEESSEDDIPSLSHLVNREDSDETIKTPFLLRGKLRPYQQAGLEWLVTLYRNSNNGILADEMGLGKTIQTIALLAWLACERGIWGPHLIIVPTSVLKNWEMEFKKFLPGFKILSYYGTTKERKERRHGWKAQHAFNVCVTSYQLILADQHIFRRMPWVYMILDEAHNIKNFKSQRWQDLFTFRPDRRLLLTGTPLQNNLMELWALMHFLNPIETVGYRSDFADWFSRPMDRALEEGNAMDVENQERVNKLHMMLRPYLLRRMKVDVEKELPAKYEHVIYCKLSKRQRYLYDEFMSRSETKEVLASGNFLSVVNCLMQLRKVCNHPDLFEVRPIVTSFAMTKSAIADYEIKELLVRRRLLGTDHLDAKHSVLHHLTSYEDTSVVAYLSRRMLDATFHLPCQREQPGVPPPVDLRTIEGYRRFRQYRDNESKRLRWKHIAYINRVRCSARPVYGREKLDCVQAMIQSVAPSDNSWRALSRGWDRSMTIPNMVKSYEQRAEAMRPIIDHFVFATPPVVTLDLPSIALRPVEKPVVALKSDLKFDTLHPAAVKLQIAFPDPSLLQFDCGKLQELDVLLKERKKGGHRALIFTQMTRVLDILEIFLNFHGYRYLRLDGSTKIEDRQKITQRFNVDTRILAFISSSRSGGVGINLTGADTVIFYDSDYNPSMDRQCEDRAHRIGQVRDVHIYRFISKHTVEESMLRKADQKRSLDDIVIRQGDFDWRKVMVSDMQMVQALEQVEEAEDAQAARNAAAELSLDTVGEEGDFGETEIINAIPNEAGEEAEQEEDIEDELESLSGVERYMVRFVERDWAFFSEWRVK